MNIRDGKALQVPSIGRTAREQKTRPNTNPEPRSSPLHPQVGPLDEMNTVPMILGRRRIAGSPIGGIRETQEMLDFCGQKNILPDCEMIRMDQINEAFERMERADVRYRFVIDMASLPAPDHSVA